MARRSTSDFETFQRCANASSTRTDSTSSEYVDLIVIVAILQIIYGHSHRCVNLPGGQSTLKSQPNRVVFRVPQRPIQDATDTKGGV